MNTETFPVSRTLALVIAFILLVAVGSPGAALERDSPLLPAWRAWENGDIDEAEKIARAHPDAAEGRHLLLLCAFVKGKYEEALREYALIDRGYAKRRELAEPAAWSYFHLGRYGEALNLAREFKIKKQYHSLLAAMTERPLKAHLDQVAVIPFAEHELADYFPGFNAEINGQKVIAHVDTGGAFLYLGPHRARELKIKTFGAGLGGFHGWLLPVSYSFGIADSLVIGEARLENVPVTVVPTLVGPQDFIIFGNCVLERFLPTLDYPNHRLILSPRNNPGPRKNHLALLPGNPVQVPFYLWGDHYMFARGGVGEMRELNFFIDSGLVVFTEDKSGVKRQAAFKAQPQGLQRWGVPADLARQKLFECPLPISLGPLSQSGHIVQAKRYAAIGSLGGVRIDGLLSHAFLKRYCWTIDFDEMKYLFQ